MHLDTDPRKREQKQLDFVRRRKTKKKIHKKVTHFSRENESTGGKNDPEYLRRVTLPGRYWVHTQ